MEKMGERQGITRLLRDMSGFCWLHITLGRQLFFFPHRVKNKNETANIIKLIIFRCTVQLLLLLLLGRFSCVRLCVTPYTPVHKATRPWDSPGKNTGVGSAKYIHCCTTNFQHFLILQTKALYPTNTNIPQLWQPPFYFLFLWTWLL